MKTERNSFCAGVASFEDEGKKFFCGIWKRAARLLYHSGRADRDAEGSQNMSWFNYAGLIFIAVIMIPNILYAVKCRDGFDNTDQNKAAVICEQIGRYGCMTFMIFNIPYTYFGFWFRGARVTYIVVNAALCLAYVICWFVLWKKRGRTRALLLSVLPSCMFLFSGGMLANIPLLVCSLIFAPCHILIGCKHADHNLSDKKSEDV